jgi:oligopeptide/dipeptide ABC transporter ATP-binding protein
MSWPEGFLTVEPLLEVRDLSVRYRTRGGADVFALTEANLQIVPGEILGVVGESGSGKSTLALSLLAMSPTNAQIGGAVFLWGSPGNNLLTLERHRLGGIRGSRISLIFQEPGLALHPTMRAGVQVEEVLKAHSGMSKEDRRREVGALLESFFGADAERIYASYPHQLSGGQRQRIAIAQAIVCKPSLLIADEPTASLDSVTQREILELVGRLRKERGLAILFITHSMELLDGFADRIAVMYGGRIVELGSAASVLNTPKHPYTQALLLCRPELEPRANVSKDAYIPVIPGEPPTMTSMVEGCAFAPRCSERMKICDERVPAFFDTEKGSKARCFKFGT